MTTPDLSQFDTNAKFADEAGLLKRLVADAALAPDLRSRISTRAAELVRRIRAEARPSLMEYFLAEYGLSTREGVALMCLAEAMLRVPDADTMDALIEDKIVPSDWGRHLGEASSSLVNASTWALMFTGRVLEDPEPGIAGTLRGAIKRLGEPVIRAAVTRAMREMGRQFVLGETIANALKRAETREEAGFTYSYDMLGEAAMTMEDARHYARSYSDAIAAIASRCTHGSVAQNPGISIKLSALHPRYEVAQEARVLKELVPVVRDLARQAAVAGMGLNIDAEEQDRLVLSLKVIEAVLEDEALIGWDGFGVVVQAYGKRAGAVIDWLYSTATRLDRRIMVRLVKGAYWDTEMKLAQVNGLPDFTLFTSKTATDVSYISNARKLLGMNDRIYPQFATHNAHTVAAILEMAEGQSYEFQRLHGMGERLHDIVLKESGGRCRIYAPVGAHRDLLAYLVRRLLENGANSSFVNQIVDEEIAPEEIAVDPFEALASAVRPEALAHPSEIFGIDRKNSNGFDLTDEGTLDRIYSARNMALPEAAPIVAGPNSGTSTEIINPASGQAIGHVTEADAATVECALKSALPWKADVSVRTECLRRAADLYEQNFGLIFSAVAQEAGKTLNDAVGELREAVDFLRYYAGEAGNLTGAPLGTVAAISPWNFPLAIFTGQIAAALAAGNAVIAKPAEQTPIISAIAIRLLHEAGVPRTALQLLPGQGHTVGAALTSDARINGVVFTGSTDTARLIRRNMATHLDPGAPLVAETGGLNAMIVDSTALREQAVRDIIASAFQSAGQRCSALRCVYLQEDIADDVIKMLKGAMEERSVGDPWLLSTDIGPVIDQDAHAEIERYIAKAASEGRVLHRISAPGSGHFVAPVMIEVSGIEDLEREIFGPVLHVARYRARNIDRVVTAINSRGFGLTFGLHTRIDTRVQELADAVHAGNAYVNRNQIGAVVGSQPFGGEGLSGTGPKAGGPLYLPRFTRPEPLEQNASDWQSMADMAGLQSRLAGHVPLRVGEELLPGPTGELNRLSFVSREPVLCLGPGAEAARLQQRQVERLGGIAVPSDGGVSPEALTELAGFSAALWWGDSVRARAYAKALAERNGPILPLITGRPDKAHVLHERHLCVDTTAAGGNAALLGAGG